MVVPSLSGQERFKGTRQQGPENKTRQERDETKLTVRNWQLGRDKNGLYICLFTPEDQMVTTATNRI